MFCKNDVLKNFTKLTEIHLCQSFVSTKVVGLRSATLLKKRLRHKCFPVNLAIFLRTPFLIEHLRWLPLISVFNAPFRLFLLNEMFLRNSKLLWKYVFSNTIFMF